jgi:hypothetical protein
MTQRQSTPKIVTTPLEIASQGVIATLLSNGCWTGSISHSVLNHFGKIPSNGRNPSIIPKEYSDNITSLLYKRKASFEEYGLPTVFGRYMTMDSAVSWAKKDIEITSKLIKTYSNMAVDRQNIVMHARKVGRSYSEQEWRMIYPGQGSPSSSFYSETEARFQSLVPSENDISSVIFWTDFSPPPPSRSLPTEIETAYGDTTSSLYYVFSRQVVSGLKSLIIEACDRYDDGIRVSGEISTKLTTILPRKLSIIKDLYFPNDEETKILIKSLNDPSFMCYKDASKISKAIKELREKAINLLDEMLIN